MKHILRFAALACVPGFAMAAPPNVVTDIAPVHGLVARVMDGVGTPDLLVEQSASPHGYALKVSQAASLEGADVVVFVSEGLSPWLHGPLETLAEKALHLELMSIDGTQILPIREEHGHDHDTHDEAEHKDHDDHDDHAEEEHAKDSHAGHGHDDHDHKSHAKDDHEGHAHDEHGDHADHAGHEGHDHGDLAYDPHGWLNPENAALWLDAIAHMLAEIDPENAQTYLSNAEAGAQEIQQAAATVDAQLTPLNEVPFMVLHDAYQYLEAHFGLAFAGSILSAEGAAPGPAGLEAAQHQLEDAGVRCVLKEPQLSTSLVTVVIEGQQITLGTIDPLGADLPLGSDFYPALITRIGESVAACLSGTG